MMIIASALLPPHHLRINGKHLLVEHRSDEHLHTQQEVVQEFACRTIKNPAENSTFDG